MFNEQLEKLVEMALIDGVLTEKESVPFPFNS